MRQILGEIKSREQPGTLQTYIHYKFYSLYILLFGFKEKIHANGAINMIKF